MLTDDQLAALESERVYRDRMWAAFLRAGEVAHAPAATYEDLAAFRFARECWRQAESRYAGLLNDAAPALIAEVRRLRAALAAEAERCAGVADAVAAAERQLVNAGDPHADVRAVWAAEEVGDGIRRGVRPTGEAVDHERLPRCDNLDGSSLRIAPAYTEAGYFCEANAVTITDGVRTAVYAPVTTAPGTTSGRP